MSLKYEDMILWKWRDVFWAYWVFFSIMVGINIGFVIILISKCYSKCSDEEVESYECKENKERKNEREFKLKKGIITLQTLTNLITFFKTLKVKGLFWMFMISNALTVNTTIYITSLINYFDNDNQDDVIFGFQYGIIFVSFMIIYSFISRKGIK